MTDAPPINKPAPLDPVADPKLSRYHRQMLLPGFGEAGQRKLLDSKALIVGCGALGTVIANQLARAGVGHLVIVDRDFIEVTNLQRQVLFDETDVTNAIPKAEAARQKIAKINSQVTVTPVIDDLNHSNLEDLLLGTDSYGDPTSEPKSEPKPCDIIVDGVDNFETRFLLNDAAVKHGIPYIYGGAVGTVGMTFAILPHTPDGTAAWENLPTDEAIETADTALAPAASVPTNLASSLATPCLQCIFEQAPPPGMNPTCDTAGVLAPTVTIIASLQVNEALKVLTGNYRAVSPTLTHIDTWYNRLRQLHVSKAYDVGDCRCCRHRSFGYLAGKFSSTTTTICGRNAVQLMQNLSTQKLDFDELANRLSNHGPVNASKFMVRASLRDNGNEYELTVFTDGRAIVKGTKEPNVAKSIYAKYVGG